MDTSNIFKLLTSFYNVFNKGNKKEEEYTEVKNSSSSQKNTNEKSVYAPINSEMIKTMRNHDEFLRRVKLKEQTIKTP